MLLISSEALSQAHVYSDTKCNPTRASVASILLAGVHVLAIVVGRVQIPRSVV
jgi:hypothetical protein